MKNVRHVYPLSLLVLAVLGSACGGGGSADVPDASPPLAIDAAPSDVCLGDVRGSQAVYFGTALPTFMPLRPGQILAIGTWGDCSGTLIAPTWVLTAAHCGVDTSSQFCMGPEADSPGTCIKVVEVQNHPTVDTTLARLETDARDVLPNVEPIPIATTPLDNSWIGRTLEGAGYGSQEDGGYGEREFTAEPIAGLGENTITVDGEGMHGLCAGDSGGPLMILAEDGTVRVTGDLSGGEGSCVGLDDYARIDHITEWIEGHVGTTVVDPTPPPCGAMTTEGRCVDQGKSAAWCKDSAFAYEACEAGSTCGWDSNAAGYRCITGGDPCGGVDTIGRCDNNTAKWCEGGTPKSRDCGSCSQLCGVSQEVGGAHCAEDPCGGVDYLGQCTGNVAEWCQNGQLRSLDCTDRGETCEFVNDNVGYYCN